MSSPPFAYLFLFDEFGWAETVFTPFFERFWLLVYYENFEQPDESRYARAGRYLRRAPDHATGDEGRSGKAYYDYAKGRGKRRAASGMQSIAACLRTGLGCPPMAATDKYEHSATDAELGW